MLKIEVTDIYSLVDYSSRYPEVIALKGIEAERVTEDLVEISTRVGIQKEILSDMGTQLTSDLMKEVGWCSLDAGTRE